MSTNFDRVVATTALIAGPLTLVITTVWQWMLQPSGTDPTVVDVAQQFPVAWRVIGLLAVFGPLVWLIGLPATVPPAATRGSLPTRIGALLTGVGLAAGLGHLAAYFSLHGAMAAAALPSDGERAMLQAGDAEPLGNTLLLVFLIGYSLGPIVLTIGLRIGHVVPVWVPLAAVVTAGANLFGGPIAGVVQLVALVVVWAPLAALVASGRATRRDTPRTVVHRKSDVGTRP